MIHADGAGDKRLLSCFNWKMFFNYFFNANSIHHSWLNQNFATVILLFSVFSLDHFLSCTSLIKHHFVLKVFPCYFWISLLSHEEDLCSQNRQQFSSSIVFWLSFLSKWAVREVWTKHMCCCRMALFLFLFCRLWTASWYRVTFHFA